MRRPPLAPVVVTKHVWGTTRVVLPLRIGIRGCCIGDTPVARVAWWDAMLDALPGALSHHPDVGERWLLGELEAVVPWPSDEDNVVATLMRKIHVPGKTAYRQETVYQSIIKGARVDARWVLANGGGNMKDRPRALEAAAAGAGLRQLLGAAGLRDLEGL